MKVTSKFYLLPALAIVSMLGHANAASISVVPSIPTTDVLVSRGDESPFGSASSQQTFAHRGADSATTDGTRGRGQSFTFDAGGTAGDLYSISSLSVALNNAAGDGTQGSGTLTVDVFTFGSDPDDFTGWNAGDGNVDGDITNGTGFTSIFNETFAVAANTLFASNSLLEVAFDAGEVTLEQGANYGFFFQYRLDDLTGVTSDITIAFDSDNNAVDGGAGALLSSFAATQGVSLTRDLNYFLTGSLVPEPGALSLLTVAGLAIAGFRRR